MVLLHSEDQEQGIDHTLTTSQQISLQIFKVMKVDQATSVSLAKEMTRKVRRRVFCKELQLSQFTII